MQAFQGEVLSTGRRVVFCLLLAAAAALLGFDNRIIRHSGFNSGLSSAQGQDLTITVRVTQPPAGSGPGISGVTVTLVVNGSTQPTKQTDSNGDVFFGPFPGSSSYQVTPSKDGWVFHPTSQEGTNQSGPKSLFFTGESSPTPGLNSVQFSQSQFNTGESVSSVATVTVTRAGDTSAPASVYYTTVDGSATQKGDYMFAAGTMTFATGETSKTLSLPIVDDVYQEGTESFSVSLSNPIGTTLGFTKDASVAITDNDAAPPTGHPLDNADQRFFIRQHYIDFLNRDPDTPGLDFWAGKITACGSNQACVENERVNASAAFFLSIEFQETGYLAYRAYKAAFGDPLGSAIINNVPTQIRVPRIRFGEFIPDTQQIGNGVQVGVGNWADQLEANKQAYFLAFVQRAIFQSAFPSSMTATQFVDQLNGRAGNVLSDSERTTLISILGTTPNDVTKRAQVLRGVAEDADLKTLEKNRAFVLMQYFGYLRRNPDDPQDTDHSGWKFWLDKLEEHQGNFVNAQMVLAFISSIEYRQRFGP
ncbi:MAG: Calx-beta domain-containing protein [Pyrinomonadaceae bacterium]